MNQTSNSAFAQAGRPEVGVDLTSCDRELVQFSQAVQPFGMLLAVSEPRHIVTEASANTAAVLGKSAASLLNAGLDFALTPNHAAWLVRQVEKREIGVSPVYLGQLKLNEQQFEAFAHRINNKLILEFERLPEVKYSAQSLYSEVRSCMGDLQTAQGIEEILEVGSQAIRNLTGYDRVIGFKFLDDGTGHILAESRREQLSSFVGLHFPPGDIPAPARRVLSLVWVRHQPDIGYVPVPIASSNLLDAPLDLSYSSLRSTSQMCNRYYLNLGVRSKLVIALLHEGQMWGAFICQHPTEKHIGYERRMACETIAHTVSLLLHSKETTAAAQSDSQIRKNVEALIDRLTAEQSWESVLADGLMGCLPCSGAATVLDGGVHLEGAAPSEGEVTRLVEWLEKRPAEELERVFSTYSLSSRFAAAGEYAAVASGLLAVRLEENSYLMWFRPELPYEVSWAGDPQKPVEVNELDGTLRLAPRTDFTMRRAQLRGLAEPWKSAETEAAASLRRAVLTIQRTDRLTQSVGDLTESNAELESFAYIASHDLREPLRGIRIYSQLLSKKLSGDLGKPELQHLRTIERLAGRMDELLESLLHCSRVGRVEPRREVTDMNALVAMALETVGHQIMETGATIQTADTLPAADCDPSQIQQVLVNLIINGLKYNSSPHKIIEIGFQDGAFLVKDNGIGIPEQYHSDVFKIFRRLHSRDEYGGGSGAGLTIVQKIVEQHGGKIWLESEPDKGSTFFFTLPLAAPADRKSTLSAAN